MQNIEMRARHKMRSCERETRRERPMVAQEQENFHCDTTATPQATPIDLFCHPRLKWDDSDGKTNSTRHRIGSRAGPTSDQLTHCTTHTASTKHRNMNAPQSQPMHHRQRTTRNSLLLVIVCLLSTIVIIRAQPAAPIDHQVKPIARDLVRRAASISSTPSSVSTAINQNDLHHKASDMQSLHQQMPPLLPPNYVKLGNNTSSHVRSFFHGGSPYRLPAPINNHTIAAAAAAATSDIVMSPSSSRRLPEKICIGTSNRLSFVSNKTEHYQNLVERYRNCTHIIGNLEITWLERGPSNRQVDLTFLESIREITGYLLIASVEAEKIRLPNLLIIRGRDVFRLNNGNKEEFAMFVLQNHIKYLELPNLREIIYGHVGFYHNRNLCSVDKIEWLEILNPGFGAKYAFDAGVPRPSCPECNSNCQQAHCWGPEENLCQQFSKTVCSPQCDRGRCYGPGPRDCCHMMCAGGCTGPKQTDCYACKNFNNDGECVPECPPMAKYNPSKFLWEPDRNGKHAYGASCVKDCPEHLLRDNGACVRSCPLDKRSQDGECVPCAGPCPKECRGVDVINSDNIGDLVNCTQIEGSITILDTSFDGYTELIPYNNTMGTRHEPMHPSRLSVLDTVRTITGYLNIQAAHPDFKDLSFLSKLETIVGRQTTDMSHSLSIIRTSLISLNLRSLKHIINGKVLIEENKNLCYAKQSQFLKNRIIASVNTTIRNNGDDKNCSLRGLKCHEQCAPGGCWGPGQEECLECNHYKLDDYCVKDCTSTQPMGILSYDAGGRTCGRCHQECKLGCSGTTAMSCWQCKHAKDGPYCVNECPKHKYNDNGICQECSRRCINGCTGASDRLGFGGCNSCDKFVIESMHNSTITASCLKPEEPCPRGYYQEYGADVDPGHPMKAFERKPICKRCHPKCKSCTGYGTHKDVCECAGYMANDQCEENCPRDFYPDEKSRRCLRCSRECNGCFGPSEADCLNCRVYRIYYESPVAIASARVVDHASTVTSKQEGRFNCTSQCPPEKPHRVSEGNLIDPYCSEDPGPDSDNPRIVSIGSTSFLFIMIMCGSIIFCVSVYRCQVEKDKTAKLAMALSLGITDNEPTKQSNIEPNRGNFNPISTSELRQGTMLGHGVGGTVYKAYWCPRDDPKKKIPVAMKILRDNGQQNMHKEFLDEAYIMASVNHDNLVNLLGVCATPKELIIVTPLMPLGCLRDYVEKNKHTIGPKHLLEWGKQIANGMAYLEEHRMVHRDLALRNVLLQNSHRALISDFGLAKFLELDQSEYHSGGGRLPIKWLAPECIRERKFTHKSDVWAFGVTIWELLTFGEKPFEELEPKDVPMAIEDGARLAQPSYVTAEVYKVMYACWFYNPEDRPNFESLKLDFVNFARDPERYLDWRPNHLLQSFGRGSNDDEDGSNEYDFDEETSLNGGNNSPRLDNTDATNQQHNRMMGDMMGIEMRQHNSESDAHKSSPTVNKMGMFSNVNHPQPLIAEDVFSRSSQQTSAKSSNTTITDPNNNFIANNNNNNINNGQNFVSGASTMRMTADSWWSVTGHTVSNNSLGHRSEQPTDSDDYLMPSPCSKEEKFTKFYDQHPNDPRLPPRPRPPSSRDPPHSAGLIGVSNDAYFITRGMRNYANTTGSTNASSGHIPSSLV